jgi:hypothetical protein
LPRIERGEEADLADLGFALEEAKRLTAALQAQIVTAQVTKTGERRRWCAVRGQMLASKGHYRAGFRTLFGEVPVRVRRRLVCPCHGPGEPKGFAALNLGGSAVAPELAYVTARYAALAPFGPGRRALVRAAAGGRGGERGHGPEPDAARRRGGGAAALGRGREATRDAGGRDCQLGRRRGVFDHAAVLR